MQQNDRPSPNLRSVALATLLPGALVLLVLLSVAPVIVISFHQAFDTANRLIGQRAEAVVDGLESEIHRLLDPVAAQLRFARHAVASGRIDLDDPAELRAFALGFLAGTPQVHSVKLLRKDGSMRLWERETLDEIQESAALLSPADEVVAALQVSRVALWARPVVSVALGDTILVHRIALERDKEFFGILAVIVTSVVLSQYVAQVSHRFDVTAFVLWGRDSIIAYPGLRPVLQQSTATMLPTVGQSRDPVVARIWDDPHDVAATSALTRSEGHWTLVHGRPYVYVYRDLAGYGPEPLTLAVASPGWQTRPERWAAHVAAGIGLVLMALAAILAWQFGRWLSRPIRELDMSLDAIGRLDFEGVALPGLCNARVREWRRMAHRIETTASALARIQTYLPQALTRRLLTLKEQVTVHEERVVTIMFFDMEGFTVFARNRRCQEVAEHLNTVFALIGPIIEDYGGVIDKYTGDGLLAFWGAPDDQPDHADRAIGAASDIAYALARHLDGHDSDLPRARIGLHTGPAIVGNVGFPGRVDYTLTGDTVNVAQRTEAALRGVDPTRSVAVAATQQTLVALSKAAPMGPETPLPCEGAKAFLCGWRRYGRAYTGSRLLGTRSPCGTLTYRPSP